MASLKVPPQVVASNRALVAALRKGQAAYSTIAAGAAGNNRGKYIAGSRAVPKADAAVQNALLGVGK